MKPVQLSKFRPQARAIAEMMWGRGGTNANKVNRNGAYYFSCAGHGGYLVAENALTEAEKEVLNPYGTREYINILVQECNGVEYVVAVDNSPMNRSVTKKRSFRVDMNRGPVRWERFHIYVFEEDCAWSILEKHTDIRLKRDDESKEYYEARENGIESTYQQWYGNKK